MLILLAVVTVSKYEDAIDEFVIGAPEWWSSHNAYLYPITFNGETLNAIAETKDNGYATFKFTLEFDKDVEEFAKLATKNDKVSVKVYNVDEYFTKLTTFYAATNSAIGAEFEKWNWSVYVIDPTYKAADPSKVDTYVDKRTEFKTGSATAQPVREIGVTLTSATGLELVHLPETHFIPVETLARKVDTINKTDSLRAQLIEGAIYYQINVPTKANGATFDIDDSSNYVSFTFNGFNELDSKEVLAATEGTYSVSLYYVNSKDKLVKLGSNVPSINVTNSTPAVKAEGFKETNVYEGSLDKAVEEILKEMYNFSWNGELLYDEDRDYNNGDSVNFEIKNVVTEQPVTADTTKIVITEIEFEIGYFNKCAKDTEGGVINNVNDLYQTYTLKKRITIKVD